MKISVEHLYCFDERIDRCTWSAYNIKAEHQMHESDKMINKSNNTIINEHTILKMLRIDDVSAIYCYFMVCETMCTRHLEPNKNR